MAEVTDREKVREEMGMTPEAFYAAPREPPSSSSLPIFDAAHVRDAMARFDQTDFQSEAEKIHAYQTIVAAAHKFGIEVEEFKHTFSTFLLLLLMIRFKSINNHKK